MDKDRVRTYVAVGRHLRCLRFWSRRNSLTEVGFLLRIIPSVSREERSADVNDVNMSPQVGLGEYSYPLSLSGTVLVFTPCSLPSEL